MLTEMLSSAAAAAATDSVPVAAIAGGVAGGVCCLLLLVALVVCLVRRNGDGDGERDQPAAVGASVADVPMVALAASEQYGQVPRIVDDASHSYQALPKDSMRSEPGDSYQAIPSAVTAAKQHYQELQVRPASTSTEYENFSEC